MYKYIYKSLVRKIDICIVTGFFFFPSMDAFFTSCFSPLSPLAVLVRAGGRAGRSSSSSPGCPWSSGSCRWPQALSPEELLRDGETEGAQGAEEG